MNARDFSTPSYQLSARMMADRIGVKLTPFVEAEFVAFLKEAFKDGYASGRLDGVLRGLDIAADEPSPLAGDPTEEGNGT